MSRDSTLTVSLTKQLRQYVRDKVEKGGYESASEVVREGLRVLKERERDERARRAEFRRLILEGQRDIDAGRTVDGPTFMKRKLQELRKRAKTKAGGR